MKQIILLFFLINILACNKQDQNFPTIDGKELLAVIENGTFKNFNSLVVKANFHITDSSIAINAGKEFIVCTAEDSLNPKNTLRANLSKDLHVSYLHLDTKSKKLFEQLKKSFEGSGYLRWKGDVNTVICQKENSPVYIIMMIRNGKEKQYSIFLERDD